VEFVSFDSVMIELLFHLPILVGQGLEALDASLELSFESLDDEQFVRHLRLPMSFGINQGSVVRKVPKDRESSRFHRL